MESRASRRGFLKTSATGAGLAGLSLALAACGGGESATPTPVADTGKTFEFEISADDNIQFSQVLLEVEAGSRVSVTLVNKSKDKQFNWVLTRFGQMLRVVTEGNQAGPSNDYVRPDDNSVLARTRLLKPGQSETITFDAPPPGDYQFFSTFPGYYTRMNGKLIVK